MGRLRSVLVVAALGVLACGCERVSERTLTDSEGRTVVARCNREGRCTLTRTAGEPVSPNKSRPNLHTTGRLVALCDVATDGPPTDVVDCRVLVCKDKTECPPAHGLPHGACVSGLCIEPANPVGRDDAVLLCLAGTGLGRATPLQVDRHALALNCGEPCRVPTPCRQP